MISAALNTIEVRARLAAMSKRAEVNALKRAARKAARPVVDELRNAWRGAARNRGQVSGAIAKAQRYSVRGSQRRGTVTAKIGTDYGRGAEAKLWHVLENGFRHYGKSAVYGSSSDPGAKRVMRRAARASGGRKIAGRRISRPISEQRVETLAQGVRDNLVRDIMGAARGKR